MTSFGPFLAVQHLHFVGVGGVGMCGLAEIALAQGLTVSGCDLLRNERTRRLSELGATILAGHDPAHLDDVDAVVVSAAVGGDADEVEAARKSGTPVVRRAELLAELMRLRRGVAVAGTHGKTTTTCLVDRALRGLGFDPTAVAGGRMRDVGAHARLGADQLLVCEADEYDRAFLALRPVWAVITNIEAEHLECYGSLAALDDAFVKFAHRVPFYGAVLVCADDPGVQRVLPRIERRVVTYGATTDADVRAGNLATSATGARFSVVAGSELLGTVELPLHGMHNVRNALAAIALARELRRPVDAACQALAGFAGVARRFEIRGSRNGVTVVDDYAHHPTEVEAALAAARAAFPDRRLIAVFQPHLFSRTRDLASRFGQALQGADAVVLLPVYPAREAPIPGVDAHLIARETERFGHNHVIVCDALEHTPAVLDSMLGSGDVMLTLGAGDVDRVGLMWLGGTQ